MLAIALFQKSQACDALSCNLACDAATRESLC